MLALEPFIFSLMTGDSVFTPFLRCCPGFTSARSSYTFLPVIVSLVGDVFALTTVFSRAAGDTAIVMGSTWFVGTCFSGGFSGTLMVGVGSGGGGCRLGEGLFGLGGSLFGEGGFGGGTSFLGVGGFGFGGSFFGVGVLGFGGSFLGVGGLGFGDSFFGEGGFGFGGSFFGEGGLGGGFLGEAGFSVGSSLSWRIRGGGGCILLSSFDLRPFVFDLVSASTFFFLGIPLIGPVLPRSQNVFISPLPCVKRDCKSPLILNQKQVYNPATKLAEENRVTQMYLDLDGSSFLCGVGILVHRVKEIVTDVNLQRLVKENELNKTLLDVGENKVFWFCVPIQNTLCS